MSKRLLPSEQSPVVFTGCCLICNQIDIVARSAEGFQIRNACPRCRQDIEGFLADERDNDSRIIDNLVDESSELLRTANMPLICGLADQSLETQRAAVELARRVGGVIDWTSGNSPFALHAALQDTGFVSCTLGEVRDRADLVVYWSCEIPETHPSFVERFIQDKASVTVDWDRKAQVAALRFLRGRDADAKTPVEFVELQQKIDAARYPVILIDDTLAPTLGDTGVLGLFRFVRAQNDRNHCRLVHLLTQSNPYGIQSTLNAMTGGPFGIAFRDGQPMYRGREFSTESLLKQGLVDLLMVVGNTSAKLPACEEVPAIWLSDSATGKVDAQVVIPVSRWGLGCSGTGLRDDGVPIPRNAIFECDLDSGEDLLRRINR